MIYIGDLINVTAASYCEAAVIGHWLYIDGGETVYRKSEGGLEQALRVLLLPVYETCSSRLADTFPVNKTLAVDLSVPWSNTTVAFTTIDRGGSPILNFESLWLHAQEPALYSFGGGQSWWATWPDHHNPWPPPALWKFVPDNTGRGKWSTQTLNTTGFYGLHQPTCGVQAFGGDVGYHLGGRLDFGTWPTIDWDRDLMIPQSGLVTYNMTTNRWENHTATEYSNYGTAHYGGAEFVPVFGPQGVLVVLGGWTSNPLSLDYSASVTPMNRIAVYEPISRTWYNQTATGKIPKPRTQFCTVGVPGDNGTYEIFMYGGTSDPLYSARDMPGPYHSGPPSFDLLMAELNLDEIYVLSLPSFVWSKADYPATSSRYGHTCEVVGNRQLLSIGGANFATMYANLNTTPGDVFTQGLGIFDITNMTWSSSYDPKAARYGTPQVVKVNIGSMGSYPNSWDDARLGQLFATKVSPGPVPPGQVDPSKPPTGAIAGGVVGGVLAIVLVIGAVWLVMRRRRKREEQKQPRYAAGQSHNSYPPSQEYPQPETRQTSTPLLHELLDRQDDVRELQTGRTPQMWELDAVRAPRELSADPVSRQ
ncbi:hypothetical protein LTR28_013455 [Elasticomyces elasticus]|nr:hypothetical protein LTR28_013455 [Elasticomyces elasticus]